MRVRKISAAIAAAAISILGVVAVATPANAANLTPTVTTSGSFVANTATPSFTVSTTLTGAFTSFYLQVPGGMNAWSYAPTTCGTSSSSTSTLAACGISAATVSGTTFATAAYKSGISIYLIVPSSTAAGPLVLTFAPSTFNTGAAGNASMMLISAAGATVDQMIAPITVSAITQTVTFNSNFGAQATTTQTANTNTSTALTANTFSRPGYNFGGWASAQGSTTVAYADGASYSFASSTTLYAIWTAQGGSSTSSPTSTSSTAGSSGLASTGAGTALPLGAAATLLIVGAAIAVIRRRREV